MTSLDRLVGDARARGDWLGVEHEYVVEGPDGGHDFRLLVGDHPAGLGGLHPDDPHARWLPDGSVLTADGREAEVATPPVPVAPGCSLDVLTRCDAAYHALRDGLDPATVVRGYSTHVNVSVSERVALRTARRFVGSHAVPMMLLLDRADSPGLLVRPRPGRLELGGEYLTGDPLRAAAVFAVASTLALRHRTPRSLRLPLKVEAAHERYGFYVDRTAAGPDLYAGGRATVLGDRTAQEQLDRVWSWTRPAAVGVLDQDELRLVDDVVAGRAPLPLETEPTAPQPSTTAGDAAFGAVLQPVRRGSLVLEPRIVTWSFVVLEVRDDGGGHLFLCVPGARLEAYLARLHAGSLDQELTGLLARRHTLPVLASTEQTGSLGAFRGLGDPRNLVPGERDPLTGRITPPGGPGSREQKNQGQSSDPTGPTRAVPRPKPKGRSLLVVAGAAAAVVLVTGGAVAVVKATSGDDGGDSSPAASGSDTEPGGDDAGQSEDPGGDGVVEPADEIEPVVRTWNGTATFDDNKIPQTITITCTDTCTVSGLTLVERFPDLTKDAPLTGDPEGTLVLTQAEKGSPCNFEKYTWPVTVTLTPQGNQLRATWEGARRVVRNCPNGSYSSWSGVLGDFTGKLVPDA